MRGVLVASAFVVALAAQERYPAFVRVVGAGDAPLAGAKVTCFVSPGGREANAAAADVVEVATDARGRAVVALLADRCYSAYAVAGAGDAARVSDVAERVMAGGEAVLRAVETPVCAELVLDGADAWAHVGPLAVFAFPRAQNRLPLPVLAGRMPPLPHWPGVQVVDAKGQVLWVRPASLLNSWGAPDPARLRTHRVVVPPPQSVPVLVQDTNGKPIAGAELWRAFDLDRLQASRWMAPPPPAPSWRWLGVSDGDGRATIEVAILVQGGKVFADELLIEARVPARALACAGITSVGGTFDNHPSHDVVADGVLRITVDEPERLRVHPPTACRLDVIGRLGNASLARAGEQGPVTMHTGADGRGLLPLRRCVRSQRIAHVTPADGAPMWAVVEPDPLGAFVSLAARTLRFEVADERGMPARGRQLLLFPGAPDLGARLAAVVPLEADGRATVRVGRGMWFVWCGDDRVGAWHVLEADTNLEVVDGVDPGRIQLVLREHAIAGVRIVDAKGAPRVGFRVPKPSIDWDSSNPAPVNRCLLGMQMSLRDEAIGHATDGDGCSRWPLLPLPRARLRIGWTTIDAAGVRATYAADPERGEVVEIVVR